MKKNVFVIILFFLLAFLFACENYEGYKRININDPKIGSFMIPKELFNTNIDGWEYIKYANDDESFAGVQYSYGGNYYIDGINYDERIFNAYFSEYEFIEKHIVKTNSNGVIIFEMTFLYRNEETSYLSLSFPHITRGPDSSHHKIEIIFIDSTITKNVLQKIAKSYKYQKY